MASAMNSLPPGFVIENPPDNARPARPKVPALPPGFVIERQPQTFQSLPTVPLRRQQQEDVTAPGIGDYASEFGNATVRGAAGTTAGILRGANVLTTDSPDEIRRTEEGITRLKTMTAEQATDFMRSLPTRLSPAVAFNYQVAIRKLWDGKTDEAQSYLDRARGYTDTRPIDEQGLSKAAANIEGAANKSFPQDPRFRGSITSDLGQGLGSTAAFLPIGLLTGGTGVAVAGAAAGADQGYQEATRDLAAQRRDDRGEAYNSGLGAEAQVKALQAGRLSALPGASEVVPVETFIQQAPRFIPGLRPIAGSPAFKRFARAFGRVGTQVLAEGGQEAFQTWAGNVINQITVDPSQALDENVLYNFAIGGAVGGGMQTVMEGYGAATGGEPSGPQPPPPAAPPSGQGRAEPRLFPDQPPGPQAGPAAPPPPQQQAAPQPDQPDQPAPARPAPPPGFVVEDAPPSGVDPGDEAYLRGAGYTPEQIADMNAPERAAAAQEARQQGVEPVSPAVTPPPPGTAPMAPRGTRQARQPVQTPDDLEAVRPVVNTEPSAAQAQAGNYQKAHVRIAGMDVTIENPRGSIRRSKDDADPWQSPALPADYGYIKRTTGRDGDQVDVYIGPDPQSDRVFVIDQMNLKTGKFDEHKAVLGAQELGQAVDLYVNSFDNPTLDRIGDVTEMSVDDFRQWVRDGRNTKRPAARAGVGTVTPNVPEAPSQPLEAPSQPPEAIGQPQVAAPDQPDEPRYNPTTIRGETQDALRRYLDGTGPVTPEAFARFAKIDVAEAGKALQYAGLRGGLIVGKNGNWRRPRTFKGPANVLDFIASIGGIRDVTGELRGMDLPKMTQFGPVVRKNGRHPDEVREQLIEAGYLFDPGRGTGRQQQTTVADVYDLIAQHMGGIQVLAAQDQAEADAIRVQKLNENMPDDWQPQNPVEGRFGPAVWADIQDYFARSGTTEEDWKTVELRDAARLIAGGMEADDAFERVAIQGAALLDDTEGLDPALEAAFQNGNPNAMVASQDVPFPDLETPRDAVEQQGPQEAGDGAGPVGPDRLNGAGQAADAGPAAEVRGLGARGGQEGGRGQDAGPVAPSEEPGAEGKPQLVIPGAEQDVRGAMQNAAKARLKASAPQKGMDVGLFGSERGQTDMFDQPQAKAEQPKAGLLDRETWPNGKWKAVEGDKVYLRVAGPFGTPASVNGEVVRGKDGDLRVRISGSSNILGGRYSGRQSQPYDSSWTVDDDPFYRNQEAKQKAEQEAEDKAWRDEMSANTEKAVADAKAAVAAGDKPLTFDNARVGLRVKLHHPVGGGDMIVGDIVEFENDPTIFYYENGRLDQGPSSAGPNEWFTVPQPEQIVSIPKYDEDGNLIEPAADDFGAMFDEAAGAREPQRPSPARQRAVEGRDDSAGQTGNSPEEVGSADQQLTFDGLGQARLSSAPAAPVFYSALLRAVEGMRQEKGAKTQWMGAIRNVPGVKAEEIAWIGLEDWLSQQSGVITKQQIADFIRANQVQVQEVVKGKTANQRLDELSAIEPENRTLQQQNEFEDINEGNWTGEPSIAPTATKYATHQLPGGENYRELLLTLPNPAENLDARRREIEALGGNATEEQKREWADIMNRIRPDDRDVEGAQRFRNMPDFRSRHWDEPNVLAHVRLNERIDADGKRVLFVEEIQSDWHQAGRKSGYERKEKRETVYSLLNENGGHEGTFVTLEDAERRREQINGRRQPGNATPTDTANWTIAPIEAIAGVSGVPDAPFKTTWPELAMKRVIRWAAENGFDRVAWTPGSVQAERYDLSKQVDSLLYKKNDDGTYGLWAQIRGQGQVLGERLTEAQLEGNVGKDIAEKIVKGEGKRTEVQGKYDPVSMTSSKDYMTELSGLDLKVGGQGMIGFYDKILVDVANKLGKKFGARTATTKMPTTADGWGVALSGEFVDENRYDSEADVRIVMRQGGLTEAGGFKPLLDVDGSAIAVHSLDITPEMRAAAMQGQPLFRARDDANQPSSPVLNRFRFAISDQQSRELTAEINQIAQRILGRRLAAVSVTERLPGDEDAYFDPNTGVIYIALQSVLDPRFNIRHEAVHALRQAGVLSEREWAVLSRMARTRWIEQYGIRERYGNLYRDRFDVTPDQLEELMVEEAIADAMAEQAMTPPGDDVVSRIFYRVRQFLRAVANMLAGRGFTTPEQILSNIEAGGVAQRRQGMGRNRGFMLYAKQESAAPQDQTQTEAFLNWFGDSKVVDAEGKPLVVYHGAPDVRFVKKSGVFQTAMQRYSGQSDGGAFWFAKDRATAASYADDRRAFDYQNAEAGIISAYLKMENPLVVDGGGKPWREAQARGKTSDVIKEAKAGGYDGVVVRNVRDDYTGFGKGSKTRATDTYVVFRSEQIKSATGNNGNFDPRRQSILESQRQESNQPPLSSVPPDDGGAGARFAQARAAATDDERAMAEFAGNINLSKIESAEDIKDVIRDAAEKADGFIAARRGVVSHDQTKELAEQLGMSVKQLLKRKSGQAFNAHEAYAARVMLVKSAEIVKKAAAKAKNTTSDVDRAYFMRVLTRHAAIQEQVAGMTAEAGRALNQFKMMAGADYLRGVGEMLSEKTSRGNMGPEAVRDMAEMIDSLDTPGQVGRMTRDMFKPRFIDMIREYYINSLLSGPATQTVNFMSNMLVALNQIPETFVAEQIGRIHGGDKVSRGETMARAIGLLEGSREGLQLAWMALKTGDPQSPETQFDQPMQKAIPGLAGEVIRLPSRLMMSSDEFFKTVNYRAEMTAMAVRAAQAEGLDGDALAERILDLRNNPTPTMIQRAAAAGKYQTFQNKLGTKGQTLMRFREAWQLWWLLPFLRTPINILKYAAERSPLGPILMSEVRENLSGKKGGAARDTQIARIALGTVMLAGMGAIVMSGMATGGGSDDEREKAVMRADGWQPYSLNIDGKYYSYLRFDPFSLHLGIVADMVELRDKISKGEYENIGWMLMASIINNVTDKTWLKSATEFSRMTMDPKAYMENYLSHLASGFVPNLLAQIARSQDPAFRDARGVLDKIKERVPGFRETLPQRYDIFGEPITGEGNVGPDLFSPVYVSTQKSNPIAQAMVDAEYFPGKPRRQINGHDLTAEQYAEYTQMSGKEAVRRLERIVKAPSWSQRNQDSKEQVLKRGYDQAREIARKMLMRKYPELRAKADQVATQ